MLLNEAKMTSLKDKITANEAVELPKEVKKKKSKKKREEVVVSSKKNKKGKKYVK